MADRSVEGIGLNSILLCKNYAHAQTIIRKADRARKIVVVGAGYIGIELVEAFEQLGKQVTLIDRCACCLSISMNLLPLS